jgi:predicted ATPase
MVGANASGKSNVRDALRVLHGVGLGYPLAEILGEGRAVEAGPLGAQPQGGRLHAARRDVGTRERAS